MNCCYGYVHISPAKEILMMFKPLIIRVYGTFLPLVKGLALAGLLVFAGATSALSSEATDTIDEFHKNLRVAMLNAELWTYVERRDFLAGPVADTFNAGLMVRLASTGRYWKTFSTEQQAELGDAFLEFTLSNYASRFKGYSGQQFVTLSEEPMRGTRVLVRTKLLNKDEEILLDYVLYPDAGGGYRVIDVFQKGAVSELAIRKSEFSPILRDQGFTGLLSLLKQMVSKLEREAMNPS